MIIARNVTGIGQKMDDKNKVSIGRISGGWIKTDEPRFRLIYGQSSSISNFNPNRNWDINKANKGWNRGESLQFDVKQLPNRRRLDYFL